MRWMGVAAAVAGMVLAAGDARALVLCRHKKSGAVVARTACTKKYVALAASDVSLGAATGGGLALDATGFAIAVGGVSTAKLANDAVTSAKLADGAVTPEKVGTTPAARVYHSASQSIANTGGGTTPHKLAFDSERFDTAALHDATNNSRLTAPIDGLYLVTANISWDGADATGARELGIRRTSGATGKIVARAVQDGVDGGNTSEQSVTALVALATGDYVEAEVRQNGAGNVNVFSFASTEEFSPEFSMVWVGPKP